MKKRKKICFLLSVLLCFLSISSSPVFGQGYSRRITGTFTNMDVFVNNIPLYLSEEPFFYEEEVYLPLKTLARQMYFSADYDNRSQKITIDTNGILNSQVSKDFSVQLLQKDYSILALSEVIKGLGGEGARSTIDPRKEINTLEDMRAYLESRYGTISGVPVTFDLRSPRDNRYLLYISFPSKDRAEFEKISRGSIEYWLEDIFYSIREFYEFNAEVEGFVRAASPSYKTYVTFETENNGLAFNFRSDNEDSTGPINVDKRGLEHHLQKELSSYHNVDFQYSVTVNRYDIGLTVYFDDKAFYQWSSSRQRSYLDRLRREINSYREDIYVYGSIRDDRANEEVLHFVFDDEGIINFYDNLSSVNSRPKSIVEPKESVPNHTVAHRNMNVWFLQPQLIIDHQLFPMLKEAFSIGDEIYIALSDLGDAMYWAFDHDAVKNQLHIIDNNYYSQNNAFLEASLLFEKTAEEKKLLEDLAYAKEQAERQKSLPSTYQNIQTTGRMESYLKDQFEKLDGIETSIQFTDIGEHSYRIRITYSKEDYPKFKNLRRNVIESWIEDMFDAVKVLYDPYAEITGSIRSTPYDEDEFTRITFDVEDRKLYFDFDDHENEETSNKSIDTQRLERALDKKLWRVVGVSFKYEVIRNRRDVDVNIYFSNNRFYDWDIFEKMGYLEDLLEEIEDVYSNLTINGRIIDEFKNETALDFSFKNGEIRSYGLLKDVEKYLDQNYGRFTHSNNTFRFAYRIQEQNSNTFDIKLEGDFFKEENKWKNVAGNDESFEAFENFVVDALNFISDFWKIDVKGEVVDKAYSSLTVKTVEY